MSDMYGRPTIEDIDRIAPSRLRQTLPGSDWIRYWQSSRGGVVRSLQCRWRYPDYSNEGLVWLRTDLTSQNEVEIRTEDQLLAHFAWLVEPLDAVQPHAADCGCQWCTGGGGS